jgi:hypothetical protein
MSLLFFSRSFYVYIWLSISLPNSVNIPLTPFPISCFLSIVGFLLCVSGDLRRSICWRLADVGCLFLRVSGDLRRSLVFINKCSFLLSMRIWRPSPIDVFANVSSSIGRRAFLDHLSLCLATFAERCVGESRLYVIHLNYICVAQEALQ